MAGSRCQDLRVLVANHGATMPPNKVGPNTHKFLEGTGPPIMTLDQIYCTVVRYNIPQPLLLLKQEATGGPQSYPTQGMGMFRAILGIAF